MPRRPRALTSGIARTPGNRTRLKTVKVRLRLDSSQWKMLERCAKMENMTVAEAIQHCLRNGADLRLWYDSVKTTSSPLASS